MTLQLDLVAVAQGHPTGRYPELDKLADYIDEMHADLARDVASAVEDEVRCLDVTHEVESMSERLRGIEVKLDELLPMMRKFEAFLLLAEPDDED